MRRLRLYLKEKKAKLSSRKGQAVFFFNTIARREESGEADCWIRESGEEVFS